jgi:hypothetical protein
MIIVKVHTILTLKSIMGGGEFAPADKIGVEAQLTRKVGSEHCYGCSVGCSQVKVGKTGTYEGIMAEGPGNRLADELGLVTISASSS